ncbi:MAG: hypothetical protein RI924_260 [Bacteroidota bacterium]|jgi:hypothetical protein
MKTLINKILVFLFAGTVLLGCKKEEIMTTVGSGTAAVLNSSTASVVLVKADIDKTAMTLSFTKPDFGYSAAVSNTLQIAKTGTNFAGAKEFVMDAGKTSKAFTGLELNTLLLSMNLPTGTASGVDVRIKSTISAKVSPVYSNVVALNVTPFAIIEYLYMPGAHQGWNASAPDSLISETGNGIFVGTIQFTSSLSQYKFLKKKAWGAPEYGRANSEGDNAPSASLLVGGQNLVGPVTSAPYVTDNYEVIADLNANTVVYNLSSWGIIGSATAGGWSDDTVMKYNNTTKKWTITASLVPGAFKFRKNHNWGTNLGGSGGTLSDGGADISIAAAGTYTITLDPVAKTYSIQ